MRLRKRALRRPAAALLLALVPAAACAEGPAGLGDETQTTPPTEAPPPLSERAACGCTADGRHVLGCDGTMAASCSVGETCEGASCVPSLCPQTDAKQSAEGCTFDTTVPDAWDGKQGCYAVLLTNTTTRPTTVGLRYRDQIVDGSKFVYVPEETSSGIVYKPLPDGAIPGSGLAIAFVAGPRSLVASGSGIGALRQCPAEPAFKVDNSSPHDSGFGPALTLTTSEPVVAADIYPFGGADSYITGASTLLPRSAAGSQYVAVVPAVGSRAVERAWIDLVALEDDTVVTLRAGKRALPGIATIPPLAPGEATQIPLRLGEAFHFVSSADVTGVSLSSDKRFTVITGTRGWGYPADADHEQLASVDRLASEYVAVGHRDRIPVDAETHAFRIVSAVDGTVLTYFPAKPDGAPDTLDRGADAIITSAAPFVVRSQDEAHPYYLGEYMSSCNANSHALEYGCPGDPEFIGVVSPAQFGTDYRFFTDPTYPTTHLVVTRAKTDDGSFADVDLDCVGALGPWTAVGDGYEYVRLDLVTDGVSEHGCANGRHTMTSRGLFGVNVWGWGRDKVLPDGSYVNVTGATSYAFPAGMGLRRLNDVTVK